MTRPLAALAALLLAATPLSAQVPRLPVFNNGVPRGILIAGDVGFPNSVSGGGETYAASGALGLGLLGFTATLGTTTPTGRKSAGVYGGTANLRLIGGPLVPLFVNLQGGVGYADLDGAKTTHVPIGVGIGLTIPLPIFGLKPWIAPRYDYTSVSGSGGNSTSAFAWSAGLDVAFIFGLGLRAAYDQTNTGSPKPSTWSIGAKWSLGV